MITLEKMECYLTSVTTSLPLKIQNLGYLLAVRPSAVDLPPFSSPIGRMTGCGAVLRSARKQIRSLWRKKFCHELKL